MTAKKAPEANPDHAATSRRPRRGFAAMDPQRQREIASLGGHAAHRRGPAQQGPADVAGDDDGAPRPARDEG